MARGVPVGVARPGVAVFVPLAVGGTGIDVSSGAEFTMVPLLHFVGVEVALGRAIASPCAMVGVSNATVVFSTSNRTGVAEAGSVVTTSLPIDSCVEAAGVTGLKASLVASSPGVGDSSTAIAPVEVGDEESCSVGVASAVGLSTAMFVVVDSGVFANAT